MKYWIIEFLGFLSTWIILILNILIFFNIDIQVYLTDYWILGYFYHLGLLNNWYMIFYIWIKKLLKIFVFLVILNILSDCFWEIISQWNLKRVLYWQNTLYLGDLWLNILIEQPILGHKVYSLKVFFNSLLSR